MLFFGHNLPKPKLASRNQKYFVSKRQRFNNRTIGLIKVMQRFLVRVLNSRKFLHKKKYALGSLNFL